MSIQDQFSNTLLSGLEILFSKIPKNVIANELEFRLGSYNQSGKFQSGQNLLQFKNIIENLQKNKYVMTEEISLDITINKSNYNSNAKKSDDNSNARISISGINNVRQYCFNDKISKEMINDVTYMNKVKLPPYDYIDHAIRVQLSTETEITDVKMIENIKKLLETPSLDKFFRYKQRYSFTSQYTKMRFDLTLIKSSTGQTFKKSGVLNKPEIYEVEVEYINGKFSDESKPETFMTAEIYNEIYNLVKWSQNSDFSIIRENEKTDIYNEYINMVFPGQSKHYKNQTDPRNFFINMPVLPLTLDKIIIDPEGNYYIKDGYSVTEKADGQNFLMFISGQENYEGSIYLITNIMEIKHTGLKTNNPNLYGSVFDGELVKLKNSASRRFLIFYCYFLNKKNMRKLPLYSFDNMDIIENLEVDKIQTNYQLMNSFIKNFPIIPLAVGINLSFAIKQYRFHKPGSKKSIFELAAESYIPENYEYELDGLIFAPYNDSYPEASLTKIVKWDRLLKWKPINQLSIDFYVDILKKDGIELIAKRDYDNPSDQIGPGWKYKQAKLKVLKSIKTKTGFSNQIIDFIPNQSNIPDLNLIKLKVDSDGEIRALDNNIIYTGSIIEFIYDETKPLGYQWIPIRFRPDKTANKAPNAVRTAENTWVLIKNPVTESMIKGEQLMNLEKTKNLQYYTQSSKALGNLVTPLRNYHNEIKKVIITKVAKQLKTKNQTIDLLDVACGRAGDLYKWKDAEINYVLGIDNDEKNLTNEEDGAIARYTELKIKKSKYPKDAFFIWGDSSRNINDGSAGLDNRNKEDLREIFADRGPSSFDIVSCQFALHYFLKSQQTIDNFLYNISINLKPGGYFIATTLDGEKVFKALEENNGIISGVKDKIRIWEIKRGYDSNDKFKNFGQSINVYNINIGQEIPEYLVNFEFFTENAKKFNLIPIENDEFESNNDNLSKLVGIQSFGDIYDKITNSYSKTKKLSEEMNEDEKKYSFMNNYLIFKKVGSGTIKPIKTNQVKEINEVIIPKPKAPIIFKSQTPKAEEPKLDLKVEEPKAEKPKKPEPKKTEPKKPEPKKTEPKKPEPKKTEPKKPIAKKTIIKKK